MNEANQEMRESEAEKKEEDASSEKKAAAEAETTMSREKDDNSTSSLIGTAEEEAEKETKDEPESNPAVSNNTEEIEEAETGSVVEENKGTEEKSDEDGSKEEIGDKKDGNEEETQEIKVAAKLDPESNLYKALQAKWELMFHRLEIFKRNNGHCCVPNRYEKDKPLGAWVSTQRRQYKIFMGKGSRGEQKSSHMTEERMRRLNEIGFVWKATDPRHTPWETRYQQLKEFYEEHGHTLIPIGYKENPPLSYWVSTQRQDYRAHLSGKSKSRLTPERIKLMNEINFSWDAKEGLKDEVQRRLTGNTISLLAKAKKRERTVNDSSSNSSSSSSENNSGGSGGGNDKDGGRTESPKRRRVSSGDEELATATARAANKGMIMNGDERFDRGAVMQQSKSELAPESVASQPSVSVFSRQGPSSLADYDGSGSSSMRNLAPSLSTAMPPSGGPFNIQDLLLRREQAARRSLLGMNQPAGLLDSAANGALGGNSTIAAVSAIQQQADQLQQLLNQQQQQQQQQALLSAAQQLPGVSGLAGLLQTPNLGALLLQERQLQTAALLQQQQQQQQQQQAMAAALLGNTNNLSSLFMGVDGGLSIKVENVSDGNHGTNGDHGGSGGGMDARHHHHHPMG